MYSYIFQYLFMGTDLQILHNFFETGNMLVNGFGPEKDHYLMMLTVQFVDIQNLTASWIDKNQSLRETCKTCSMAQHDI